MPKGDLARYKVIHCETCGKIIARFDRKKYSWHVPKDVILKATRRHYKKHHPKKFASWYKK